MTIEKILEQGTKYANENWNVHENPNEHDNAHDDFIAGALWAVKNYSAPNVVESSNLVARDEQGTPTVDEDGTMTCNCAEPKQSLFPNGKYICIKCWGEWYH